MIIYQLIFYSIYVVILKGNMSFYKIVLLGTLLLMIFFNNAYADYFQCAKYDKQKKKTSFNRKIVIFYEDHSITVIDSNYSQKLQFIKKDTDDNGDEYLLFNKKANNFLYEIKFYPKELPLISVNSINELDNLEISNQQYLCYPSDTNNDN